MSILNAPHLFAENHFMHIYNDQMINDFKAEKVTVHCHGSVVSPTMSQASERKLIGKCQKNQAKQQTCIIP